MDKLPQLLEKLSRASGPSGLEDAVCTVIESELTGCVTDIKRDPLWSAHTGIYEKTCVTASSGAKQKPAYSELFR